MTPPVSFEVWVFHPTKILAEEGPPHQNLKKKVCFKVSFRQWQSEFVQDGLRNQPLKFRVSNSWDIDDIEFVWVGGMQSQFCVQPPTTV